MKVNEKHKDRLFCLIFGNEKYKENLLSLYNALNGTSYDDVSVVEITTIEDAVYMKMKNDVSCIFSSTLSLYEHQSTYNPNMPFREFQYCAKLYNKHVMVGGYDLYGSKLVKIPTPQCYVFYNGTGDYEDRKILRLSDAFEYPKEGYEWTTYMLNINAGHNKELMKKCQALNEYSILIARIRSNRENMSLEDAVDEAVRYVIDCKGTLSGLLESHRSEVFDMCITEYNEELHLKTVRDEGREEGREEERSILGQAFDLFYNGFNTVEKLLSKGIAKEDAEFVVKTLAR